MGDKVKLTNAQWYTIRNKRLFSFILSHPPPSSKEEEKKTRRSRKQNNNISNSSSNNNIIFMHVFKNDPVKVYVCIWPPAKLTSGAVKICIDWIVWLGLVRSVRSFGRSYLVRLLFFGYSKSFVFGPTYAQSTASILTHNTHDTIAE